MMMSNKYLYFGLILFASSFFLLAQEAGAFLGPGQNTQLYHSYDGMVCSDCHTMHNSRDGSNVIYGGPYAHLLAQPTITDICLQCHGWPAAQAFNAPAVMTFFDIPLEQTRAMPSGNFYWSSVDSNKGHNPGRSNGVQSVYMPADSTLTTSPGGNYSTETDWDCATCHGVHDRFGADITSWRKLRRKVNGVVHTGNETVSLQVESYGGDQGPTAAGYEPILSNSRGDIRGGTNNTNYVGTRADGNPIEGANLFIPESDTNKNIYRGGFSSFCSVCHGNFHGGIDETRNVNNGNTVSNGSWIRHPSNLKLSESSKYGLSGYSAQVTNAQGTSPNPVGYDWRYPLVQPDADFTVKTRVAAMTDPTTLLGDDRIMCLTCHKAHATQYANMTRWDTEDHAFIADGDTDFNDVASNGDNPAYGCGKCHQKGGTKAFVRAF